MSVRLVDFKTKRHKATGKALLDDACFVIGDIGCQVAGYAVVAWDDKGQSSVAFRGGGPIASGAVGTHVATKINASLRMETVGRETP